MRLALLAAAAAALLSTIACRREPTAPRLVLLYAPCTVHRDAIAPYGTGVPYTPGLAAFARESVVFLRHQTETDQSGPAYASLFSGAQVDRHGVFRHPSRLPTELYLAAEAFAERGYETHFWSGHPMASAELDYGQGVAPQRVHHRKPGIADLYALTANDAEFAAILERLRREPSYRAFVQVNFTVTHGPYAPVDPRAAADFRRDHPAEWPDIPDAEIERLSRLYAESYLRWQWDYEAIARERKLSPADRDTLGAVVRLCYKINVRLLDHCFGRVVDGIRSAGLIDESLIAFTADHGETLDRASALFKWTHGAEITPEAIEVPLVVRLPGPKRRAGSYAGISRSIDVYPTLAGLAGFSVPRSRGVDGADLSRAVRGEEAPPSLQAFSHTTLPGPELVAELRPFLVARYHPTPDPEHMWVSVRDGDRYVRLLRLESGAWGFDVFDLARRPLAAPSVLGREARADRDLARELEGYKAKLLARYAAGGQARSLNEAEARERLRSLGYIQ